MPTDEALQAVLHKIITRMLKPLSRRGALVEQQGSTYMGHTDADSATPARSGHCRPPRVHTASPTAERAGQKVLSVQGAMP